MSVPSLPLDIVVEIISHLEQEEEKGEPMSPQIEDGKVISLVCRSWRIYGQRLRWKVVKVTPSHFSSLVSHVDANPHLARLIRSFKLYSPDPTIGIDPGSLDEGSYRKLPKLLKKLVNLQRLAVLGNVGQYLTRTFKVSSRLQSLAMLQVFLFGEVEWSNELVSSLQTGFKRLSSFAFQSVGSVISSISHSGEDQSSSPKVSVENMRIAWMGEPTSANQVASDFLSVFDSSGLKHAALLDLSICTPSIDWLAACPHLLELDLSFSITQNLDQFSHLVSTLSHFRSLQSCRVDLLDSSDRLVESPVALLDFLTNFPSSLTIFEAKQFVFTDSSSLSIRTCPSHKDDKRKYVPTLGAKDREEGMAVRILVWGEENEGKISWYRQVPEAIEEAKEEEVNEGGEGEEEEAGAEEGAEEKIKRD